MGPKGVWGGGAPNGARGEGHGRRDLRVRLARRADRRGQRAALGGRGLLAEGAKSGVGGVRRIYGEWTTPNLARWKAVLLDHSIPPVQRFHYTVGKNATDSAMIIDAVPARMWWETGVA